MNPWEAESAAMLHHSMFVLTSDRDKARAIVATMLARAYEHGFAQGRLAEIDASAEARRRAGVVDGFVEATLAKMQENAEVEGPVE